MHLTRSRQRFALPSEIEAAAEQVSKVCLGVEYSPQHVNVVARADTHSSHDSLEVRALGILGVIQNPRRGAGLAHSLCLT